MASSGPRKFVALVNINNLGVLVLVCPVIFVDTDMVAVVIATVIVMTCYYVCGRCVPEE